MNILYVVFVNEKPVWEKETFQENSSNNKSAEKNI